MDQSYWCRWHKFPVYRLTRLNVYDVLKDILYKGDTWLTETNVLYLDELNQKAIGLWKDVLPDYRMALVQVPS